MDTQWTDLVRVEGRNHYVRRIKVTGATRPEGQERFQQVVKVRADNLDDEGVGNVDLSLAQD